MKSLPPIVVELPSDDLGGASGARYFHVLAVGKTNTPEYPYNIANEKIATEVGRALGLRIPEILLKRVRGNWYSFSNFVEQTESGEAIPEGTAAEIDRYYKENPSELHGMICFDLLVGNNDRKTDSLIMGDDGRVRLIDHANSLFYRNTKQVKAGIERLNSIEQSLTSMFDRPHWFLRGLTSWEYVDRWCDRIANLPSYLITSVLDDLPSELLTDEERSAVFTFLETRKLKLGGIIESNLPLFPGLRERGGNAT